LTGSDKYEMLEETARRRGFFWPSFEIYGGASGFIDFGPVGAGLKRKIEEKWRDFFVRKQHLMEVVTPTVMPGKVLEASGHVAHFKDPMVECTGCKRRYRADHILRESVPVETESLTLEELDYKIRGNTVRCPECGGEFSKPEYFQTMFATTIGPYSEAVGYCRPEAAQGMFINFKRVLEIAREKLPLGVAQIGKALRNEISPRQGPIRLREFTIMEFEFFFDPEKKSCDRLKDVANERIRIIPVELRSRGVEEPLDLTVADCLRKGYIVNEWMAYFMALSKKFVTELGIPLGNQRFHEKLPKERAHYSAQTYDHEVFLERWGWTELAGHAYRTDYDLLMHSKHSGVDIRVFDKYEKPITKKLRVLQPVASTVRRVFKQRTEEVLELIRKADLNEVEKGFIEKGYYQFGDLRILPEHVEIKLEEEIETGRRFIPHVVEPSFGAERLVYATLEYAYSRIKDRTVMRIPRDLAPIQAVVLPLVSRDGLPELAKRIYDDLTSENFDVEYDEAGSIGRRYARADEVGVPLAITVDYRTKDDETVTVRDRDSWRQVRVKTDDLPDMAKRYLSSSVSLEAIET